MDLDLVEALTRLFIESNLEEMEVEEEGFHLRLVRSVPSQGWLAPPPEEQEESLSVAEQRDGNPPPPERQWITATLVGRFRQATPPIQLGDFVEEGQVVGQIEAMSVLNPVKAHKSGRVIQIAVEEGQPVEYGQRLIEVEVESPSGDQGEEPPPRERGLTL